MSQNRIGIEVYKHGGKDLKPKIIRFNGNTTLENVMQELMQLSGEVSGIAKAHNELKNYIDREIVFKVNGLKTAIERTTEASITTVVAGVVSGSISAGGSSTSTSGITTVSVSLTGGSAAPQVFSAPAQLLGVPIGYATVEGMVSAEILAPTSLTVTGFTITSLQDCVAIYSYKLL